MGTLCNLLCVTFSWQLHYFYMTFDFYWCQFSMPFLEILYIGIFENNKEILNELGHHQNVSLYVKRIINIFFYFLLQRESSCHLIDEKITSQITFAWITTYCKSVECLFCSRSIWLYCKMLIYVLKKKFLRVQISIWDFFI